MGLVPFHSGKRMGSKIKCQVYSSILPLQKSLISVVIIHWKRLAYKACGRLSTASLVTRN